MIESRYSIEYVETEANQEKSFSILKFALLSLLLASLGVFTYSTITGTSLDSLLSRPFNYLASFINTNNSAEAENTSSSSRTISTDSTDNTASGDTRQATVNNNSETVSETEIKLKSTINKLEEKIKKLTTENAGITQKYNNLLKEKALLEKNTKDQLSRSNSLSANLNKIKAQLAAARKDNLKLSEQLAIQQVENETLSSLLKSSKTAKKEKEKVAAAPVPNKPNEKTAVVPEQTPVKTSTTSINNTIDNTLDSSVQTARKKESDTSNSTDNNNTTQQETASQVAADKATLDKEKVVQQAKTETAPKPVKEAAISSDVDAIMKAMQSTSK